MILLYRIYFIFIALPILFVATVITAIITAFGSILFHGPWFGYYPAHIWSKLFCILSFVRITIKGRDNVDSGTQYVFVANHQGAYDIFSIYGYLGHRFKWMMKKSLEKIPLVGYACLKAGHIFVDNSSSSALLSTMRAAENQLKDGVSLVVFPEGSRTKDGHIQRFKRGAYQLSREFQLPLVPITIDGAYKVMKRTAILPTYGHITLTIHKPVPPPAFPDGDLKEAMDITFKEIESSLPEENRKKEG